MGITINLAIFFATNPGLPLWILIAAMGMLAVFFAMRVRREKIKERRWRQKRSEGTTT